MELLLGVFLILVWLATFVLVGGLGCRVTYWSARERDSSHEPLWKAIGLSVLLGLGTLVALTLVIGVPLLVMGF